MFYCVVWVRKCEFDFNSPPYPPLINGAAVFLEVKLIHGKMACSSETEGYVSWRLSDKLMEGRVSLAAFGFGDEAPTVLL